MNGSNGKIIELLERLVVGQETMREEITGRLDHMMKFLGGHHADHEQRIKALEKRVFKKSG